MAPTKKMDFAGKWVLVTGASSGLGREMARVLAREHGAHLILVARREDRLMALQDELERDAGIPVLTIAADLANLEEVQRVFDMATQHAPVYAAVLNAGVTHFGHWDECSWDEFAQMQALNNTGVAKLTRLILPYLEQRHEQGGLMLVASMTGVVPTPYQSFYSATKAFTVHLGACLHHEMRPRGVSVTTFVPGGIDTEMTKNERFNSLRGWLMPADRCARAGISAFKRREYVYAPGVVYRWGGKLTRLLPQRLFVASVADQYRRSLEKHKSGPWRRS
jgi:uncharacterized protein